MTPVLIVLNAGSSSLKFQVFESVNGAEPRLSGEVFTKVWG